MNSALDDVPALTQKACKAMVTTAHQRKSIEIEENDKPDEEVPISSKVSKIYILYIYSGFKFSIFKPLIPLKITLFLWFGATSVIQPFLSLYLKQRGITLSELSTIYIITPGVQLFGSLVSGFIADRTGRSKPVLITNLVLAILFVIAIRIVPDMNPTNVEGIPIHITRLDHRSNKLLVETLCDMNKSTLVVRSCVMICPGRKREMKVGNLQYIDIEDTNNTKGKCLYRASARTLDNTTHSFCNVHTTIECSMSCILMTENNPLDNGHRTHLFFTALFVVLFLITSSNTFRFLDVTAMSMVKHHDKDFGRERMWAIMGVIVWSPLSGYVINLISEGRSTPNYDMAFILFCVLASLSLISLSQLNVVINPPGEKMWRKTISLIKNPDYMTFVIVLFVLGIRWGFKLVFNSWYLSGMGASSVLLGILPAVHSLYGLPFLFTSRWWVDKIGSRNIFLLALTSGAVGDLGLALIQNPWWDLALELSRIFTSHLLWVAVVLHSHAIAPEGLTATVIACAGGLHYGIGKGFGSLIGGLSMEAYGGRIAFLIMAVMCSSTGTLYALYLCIKERKCQYSPIEQKAVTFNAVNEEKFDVVMEPWTELYNSKR